MTDEDRRDATRNLPPTQPSAPDPALMQTQGFGASHVLGPHPDHPHTHTIVFLHGRGSGAEEFAEELMESSLLSDGRSLQEALPGWRWVFPAAREVWSDVFEEFMPMWFELRDGRENEGDPEGLREAVGYVKGVLDEERRRLQEGGKVMLGGISQGGAVAMWTMLSLMGEGDGDLSRWMGGFVGSSTWMPLGDEVEWVLRGGEEEDHNLEFVRRMLGSIGRRGPIATIPVLMGHGVDDAYVDVELGRQAERILGMNGCNKVEWREYEGAEQEGHWFKVPEQMDHILEFLRGVE
ncbi:hypothetical protein ACJ41O_000838 [Fusarium nematophilum]